MNFSPYCMPPGYFAQGPTIVIYQPPMVGFQQHMLPFANGAAFTGQQHGSVQFRHWSQEGHTKKASMRKSTGLCENTHAKAPIYKRKAIHDSSVDERSRFSGRLEAADIIPEVAPMLEETTTYMAEEDETRRDTVDRMAEDLPDMEEETTPPSAEPAVQRIEPSIDQYHSSSAAEDESEMVTESTTNHVKVAAEQQTTTVATITASASSLKESRTTSHLSVEAAMLLPPEERVGWAQSRASAAASSISNTTQHTLPEEALIPEGPMCTTPSEAIKLMEDSSCPAADLHVAVAYPGARNSRASQKRQSSRREQTNIRRIKSNAVGKTPSTLLRSKPSTRGDRAPVDRRVVSATACVAAKTRSGRTIYPTQRARSAASG